MERIAPKSRLLCEFFNRRNRIEITGGFLLLIAWLNYLDTQGIIPLALLACVFHELGHLCAICLLGGRVRRVSITAVGAEIELEGSLSYGREILSALAGPLANFVLANVFCRLPGGAIFSGLNLVLACFNLLPIGRLDGGRILNCALSWGVGPEIAWNVGHRLDCLLSGLLLVAGITLVQAGNSFTLFLTSIWIYSTFTGRRKTMLRQKQTKRRNSLYQN